MIEMQLSIEDTISKPVIRSVFKGETGGTLIFSVAKVLVSRFVNSFAFSIKLNDEQIERLTVDLLTHFEYESLEDIIIFLKMARSGKFGIAKSQITANLLFGDWFPLYLEQKADVREQSYREQKGLQNSKPTTDHDVMVTYKKMHDRVMERKVDNYIDEITKTMDRQMLEDTILSWSKDSATKNYVEKLKLKRKTITK